MSQVSERDSAGVGRGIFWLIVLFLSLFMSPMSAAAPASGRLRLRVQGLDGATPKGRRGRALPLVIHADNRSGGPLRGLIQIYWTENRTQLKARQRVFHNRRVELAAGERRLLICPEIPLDSQDKVLVVSVLLDDGVSPDPILVEPVILEHGLSVLWTSDRPEGRTAMPTAHRAGREGLDPVSITSLRPEALPATYWAYESFDVLIIADSELAELDGVRLKAVRDFVSRGGTLVFSPGDLPGQVQRSPLADILPVTGRSTSAFDDRNLTSLAPLIHGRGPGLTRVHSFKARETAQVLVSDGDEWPLVVAGRYGCGRVIVLAFSLQSAGLQSWRGRDEVLLRLCPGAPRTGIGRLAEAPWTEWAMNRTARSVEMEPPGLLILGPLLLLYGLFVAPLSARLSRSERAGLRFFGVAMLLVASTTSVVWFLTSFSRPGSGLVLESELIRLPCRPLASSESFPEASFERVLGLFQSKSGTVSAELEGGRISILRGESANLAADFEDRSEGRVLRRMRGGAGTFRRVFERGARELGGVAAEFQVEQDILAGEIQNASRLGWRSGVVVWGGQVASLESFKAGERRALRLPLYAISAESKACASFFTEMIEAESPYFRYFPSDAVEREPLDARQRLVEMLRSEGLEALRSAPATALLFALVDDPDSSEPSSWGMPRRRTSTLIRVELPLRFGDKGLRLSSLPAFYRGNHEPVTFDGKRLGYEIQGAELLGEEDPLTAAIFEFPLPACLPENWSFSELSFEGTFYEKLGLGKVQLQFWQSRQQSWGPAFDFSISRDSVDASGFARMKLKASEPESVMDRGLGRVVVRIRNSGSAAVIASDAFLRLQGGPARR